MNEEGRRFQLSPLPYAAGDLAPLIGEETVSVHHGVILRGHVDALNILLDGLPQYRAMPLRMLVHSARLPRAISEDVRWHGGAILLHDLYFASVRRLCGGYQMPGNETVARLKRKIGSYEEFCYRFREAVEEMRGSGFVSLALNRRDGCPEIVRIREYTLPDPSIYEPIFAMDVWEHSYYGDYRADRRAATNAFLALLDWRGREGMLLSTK